MSDQPHFLKDLEVREMQSLDHAKLASSVFAGVLLSSPPFRLALFGPWGSGKTTILKLVQSEIEQYDGQVFLRAFWFNAWEYESSANLFYSLANELVQVIPDGVRYSRKGSGVVQRVLEAARLHGSRWAANRPVAGPPAEGQEAGVSIGMESIRTDLERFTDMLLVSGGKGRNKRLAVIVDDLDKCSPLQTMAFLESMKLFFGGRAPIVFICSMDADVLRRVVQSKYGHAEPSFAESYIEKIFEFSYQVSSIRAVQVRGLVEEIYRRSGLSTRALSKSRIQQEQAVLEQVLSRSGLNLNPRRIKRIFNRFIWFLCHEPVMDDDLSYEGEDLEPALAWLLATEYWRALRDFVGQYGETAFKEIGNRVTGHPLFPHSNEGCKSAFGNMDDARSLIDFLRASVTLPDDPHLPESQEEMRATVMRFARIDGLLRSFGM